MTGSRSIRCLLLVALASCGRGAHAPVFELRDVSAPAIAALEAIASAAPQAPPPQDLVERVRGAASEVAHSQGKLRKVALEDLNQLGDPAVPILETLLDDTALAPEERQAALEALVAIGTPAAADALAKRVELSREPWERAFAAAGAGALGHDRVVPRLALRLKYEVDGETVIQLATALARFANYAGLDGLRTLAAGGNEIGARAQATLAALAADAGFADAETLYAAWNGADPERRLPRREPTPQHQLEIWRCVRTLADYDLRKVDDARFKLSRSADWAAEPLRQALHEKDPFVRVHAAQCLERMGERARSACAELVRALDEPRLSSNAAAALGALHCAEGAPALIARTRPTFDVEMRTACASALGPLGDASSGPALLQLLDAKEPLSLQQAAAQALVELGLGDAARDVLIACLVQPGADASGAETALERWLQRRAEGGDPTARDALARWIALAGHTSVTPPPEAVVRRQHARAELLQGSGQVPDTGRK